ncbi:MAG: hypothetical protein LBO71_03750 [Prevotellaceae bacterium]|jgi:hypothetical protein|nr:hypothetical protein [Prevotellaceae bacterium]
MKKLFLQNISRRFSAIQRCPYCGKGKARLSLLWFIDVDAKLACSSCKAQMAHVNFLCTAVLYSLGIMLIYVMVQRWGLTHSIDQLKARIVALALAVAVAATLIRLVLLYLLWWIKKPEPARDA